MNECTELGIFDECGLGKTLESLYGCIDLIKGNKLDNIVVICRARHAKVWEEQVAEHEPRMHIHNIVGLPTAKRKQAWPIRRGWMYIINYELLSRAALPQVYGDWVGTLTQVGENHRNKLVGDDAANLVTLLRNSRCAIVADESQAFKNPKAKLTRVMHLLRPLASRRYILTGTPVAEHPDDVWSQIYFLDGGKLLGKNYWSFITRYAHFVESGGRRWIGSYRHLDELRNKLNTISIRRLKETCLDMPPKTYKPAYCYATGDQKKLLKQISKRMIRVLTEMGGKEPDNAPLSVSNDNISSLMQMMQRATVTPWLVDPNVKNSAKLEALLETLEEEQQVLVWCVHRDVTEALCQALNDRDIKSEYIHGGVSIKDRDAKLDTFKTGKYRVLLATIASLRESVTITNCTHSFYAQLDYSKLSWEQSQSRTHRIGQTGTVVIEPALMDIGLDGHIWQTLQSKEKDASQATDGDDTGPEITIRSLLTALKGQ
jgi:SNF2 family DNA or RNA helicase